MMMADGGSHHHTEAVLAYLARIEKDGKKILNRTPEISRASIRLLQDWVQNSATPQVLRVLFPEPKVMQWRRTTSSNDILEGSGKSAIEEEELSQLQILPTHWEDIVEVHLDRIMKELYQNCSYEMATKASLNDPARRHPQQKTATACHQDQDGESFTYGEIEADSFFQILQFVRRHECAALEDVAAGYVSRVDNNNNNTNNSSNNNNNNNNNKNNKNDDNKLLDSNGGGVFYDLGSGSGRAVFVARLTQDFRYCVGIELLSQLHEMALSIHNQTIAATTDCNSNTIDDLSTIHFYQADLVEYDWWSNGHVVFCHSTCFTDHLMFQFMKCAQRLVKGSYIISLRELIATDLYSDDDDDRELNGLNDKGRFFRPIHQSSYRMSWGIADVYIYQRK